MESFRNSAHTQQAPRTRKSSGQNSNRHKKLLETRLSYTKQRMVYASDRHKMRALFAAHQAVLLDSLPLNVLAARIPAASNRGGFQVVSGFACSSLVTRHSPLVSNRQFSELPELEIDRSHTKQSTSLSLIANFGALLAPPNALKEQFS